MAGPSAVYIGAIDEGTSSSRFLLFTAGTGELVCQSQEEVTSHYPHEGWCEQDPVEILDKTVSCMGKVLEMAKAKGITETQIKCIGITNQRETTVVWDKRTGKPFCNAIVWLDIRTAQTADQLIRKTPDNSKYHFQKLCGLPITTYFSAVKLRWILDNVEGVKEAVEDGNCLFGTVDTWLVWNLTGGVQGGKHVTDVTNASRTMLMNLHSRTWDTELCNFFDVNQNMLPEIRSSSEIYGHLTGNPLKGIPISGILGDQQAALVGQKCLTKGSAKNTYGTGNFLLYNTGTDIFFSEHGMLTTVAYQFGSELPVYALEGSVAITGAAVKWLRDNLGIIKSAAESEVLAKKVSDSGGVYFVPAFSGLYAPYWRSDARGLIIGLTQYTNSAHIVRATLEAVCFQSAEILEAMNKDSGIPLEFLKVDGGMVVNTTLMQMQADILGIPVKCPKMCETTALGAAMAAGNAKGINVWPLSKESVSSQEDVMMYSPCLSKEKREETYLRWKKAVQRTLNWEENNECP